ncbi:uncharacterized protein SCHCODRAFT_02559566 [Schizophyllum commune H4-8]|uniref:uncharacterized protein n=1 Tax=Schizophyllum commune (strain H4-8 / FGSC 9210) TaxID=578458 RepID=UPI0021600B5D|nr:uncharacterized protein SCHCODRAFT_02559566 [Schizophyllum commune H4-8]KAI5900721.1 hypothetical protein SCHCODRAFT_02559566 [Schizophyllum commune H4-8]
MPVQQSTSSAARAALRRCRPYGAPLDNNGKPKVARPPNAFILFRSDYIAKHEGEKHQRSLSQAAGATWNLLTDAEKLPYQRKAQEIAERFKRENPDYEWNTPKAPSSKSPRSRAKKSSPSSAASSSKTPRTKSGRAASGAAAPASPITNSDASTIDWSEVELFSVPSPSPSSWSTTSVTSSSWESGAPTPVVTFTEDDFTLPAAFTVDEPAPIPEDPAFYQTEPPYVPNDPYFCNEVYPYPTADPSSPEFAAQLQQFAILPHRQEVAYDTFLCDGSSW